MSFSLWGSAFNCNSCIVPIGKPANIWHCLPPLRRRALSTATLPGKTQEECARIKVPCNYKACADLSVPHSMFSWKSNGCENMSAYVWFIRLLHDDVLTELERSSPQRPSSPRRPSPFCPRTQTACRISTPHDLRVASALHFTLDCLPPLCALPTECQSCV